MIDRGKIEISAHSHDGRKLALDILGEGDIFGEIALFGGDRTATATALTDCALRRIRRGEVMATLRRRPELALDFIDVLCDRLRMLSRKLEERVFLPVPVRVASRLLYLDAKLGGASGAVAVSQADLADFVGATREAIAKTLAVWRRRNWVALSRGSIRIVDRAALERVWTSARGIAGRRVAAGGRELALLSASCRAASPRRRRRRRHPEGFAGPPRAGR